MPQPEVTLDELDGALGVLPPSSGALMAFVGVSSSGTEETPATYGRVTDLVADFGVGPLVEAAAHAIERTGRPVVVVRTGQTTAGDYGAIDDDDVTGTANGEITETPATEPLDDYEVKVLIVAGGTTGTTGITYKTSLDGGRTYGPTTALGVSLVLAIAGTGVSFTITTGKTLIAGDSWTCRTTAPLFNGTEIGDALDALKNSAINWGDVHISGALDATLFDAVDAKLAAMAAAHKYHGWIGHVRVPTVGESESTYLASVSAAFAAKATVLGMLCAGAEKLTSSVSGRKYKRPTSFSVAARIAAVSEEVDIADVNLGSLVGVSIRDDNGNPDEHDETVNPGLDDARFTVLRTWQGLAGVYVNNPNVLSAEGSDFKYFQHRRVMNLALATVYAFMIRRLSKAIRVHSDTGFILEAEALEIEAGARAAMRDVLLAKPKASGVQFTLSRTDNLLSGAPLNGSARIVPLAYPKSIALEVGFLNPALNVQAV